MFDEDETQVSVTMIMHNHNGSHVTIENRYNEADTWRKMAYQFYRFLAAQGYVLEKEDVGASDYDL